jgi:hypothetical protein
MKKNTSGSNGEAKPSKLKPSPDAFKPSYEMTVKEVLEQTGLHPVLASERVYGHFQVLAHDGEGKLYFLSQSNCSEINPRESTRLFRFIQQSAHSVDFNDAGISVWLTILSGALASGRTKVRVHLLHPKDAAESNLSPNLLVNDMIERGLTESRFQNR